MRKLSPLVILAALLAVFALGECSGRADAAQDAEVARQDSAIAALVARLHAKTDYARARDAAADSARQQVHASDADAATAIARYRALRVRMQSLPPHSSAGPDTLPVLEAADSAIAACSILRVDCLRALAADSAALLAKDSALFAAQDLIAEYKTDLAKSLRKKPGFPWACAGTGIAAGANIARKPGDLLNVAGSAALTLAVCWWDGRQ